MRNSKGINLPITIVLIILALVIGYSTASFTHQTKTLETAPSSTANQILQNQTAEIPGIITEVNGNMATISSDTHLIATFPIIPQVTFYSADANNQVKASVGTASIPLNKHVLIKLQLQNGQYQITQIFSQPLNQPAQVVAAPPNMTPNPITTDTPQPTVSPKAAPSKTK